MEWYRIHRLVERLAAAREGITIDGAMKDWEGFPFIRSRLAATDTSPPVDLALAIAPGKDEILFCLVGDAPAETWIRRWSDVGVDLEVEGRPGEILRLSFGQDAVRANAWEWNRTVSRILRMPGGAVDLSFRACIEGRIRLSPLRAENDGPLSPGFLDTRGASWMRLSVNLREPPPRGKVGPGVRSRWRSGPSAASYLLEPADFSPPWAGPPPDGESAVRCPFFLSGRWLVSQGGREWPTHEDIYAYDFCMTDERGLPVRGEEGDFRNEDSQGWEAEILAPSEGRVGAVSNGREDHPPIPLARLLAEGVGGTQGLANELKVKGPFHWLFVHLRKGSIPLQVEDKVRQGQVVGRVGNSGFSTGPHLHAEFVPCRQEETTSWKSQRDLYWQRPGPTVPLVLEDVLVGLNGAPDDPWVVRLPEWEVRSGYQVSR